MCWGDGGIKIKPPEPSILNKSKNRIIQKYKPLQNQKNQTQETVKNKPALILRLNPINKSFFTDNIHKFIRQGGK